MKTRIMTLSAGLMMAGVVVSQAALASWDFETSSGTGPYAANSGSGTLTASPNFGIASITPGGNLGNQLNFVTGDAGGNFIIQVSGSIQLSTLTYDAAFGSSLTSQTWEWGINGSTFPNSLGSQASKGTSYLTTPMYNIDLSGVSGSTIYLRDMFNGDARFDNIAVSAVPEPVNVALLFFGLCVGVTAASQRIHAWLCA